jgi:hypothetical protein
MSQLKQTNIVKTINGVIHDTEIAAVNFGLVALAALTVVGMTELSDHQEVRRQIVLQPQFALAPASGESLEPPTNSDVRKERDEVAHRPISYGVTMRSHATSGKR